MHQLLYFSDNTNPAKKNYYINHFPEYLLAASNNSFFMKLDILH